MKLLRSAIVKRTSCRRADRAPERCPAGGGLLGGKDPTGRFRSTQSIDFRNGRRCRGSHEPRL